jgi:hypothetical protein
MKTTRIVMAWVCSLSRRSITIAIAVESLFFTKYETKSVLCVRVEGVQALNGFHKKTQYAVIFFGRKMNENAWKRVSCGTVICFSLAFVSHQPWPRPLRRKADSVGRLRNDLDGSSHGFVKLLLLYFSVQSACKQESILLRMRPPELWYRVVTYVVTSVLQPCGPEAPKLVYSAPFSLTFLIHFTSPLSGQCKQKCNSEYIVKYSALMGRMRSSLWKI